MLVLAYRDRGGANRVTADSHRRYFLPTVKIEIYNIKTDDQPVNNLIKQHDDVRKVSTRQGYDYTTGYLLNFAYFKKITV